jgi:hypothetical protein
LEQQLQARAANIWPRSNGENVYASVGTYSWVCPANVTFVSVVCVGSSDNWNSSITQGKGGGGLGYKNTIPVVPGNSYTVQVGGIDGPRDSFFINSSTVRGGGGNVTNGGTFTGDGGGNGGNGSTGGGGGGGGAGGYSGTGGSGGVQNSNGNAGSGGGGGGGAGKWSSFSGGFAGGGGGVGIYGEGASGAGGVFSTASSFEPAGGRGGSGGTNGSPSNTGGAFGGASYGGGLAGSDISSVSGGGGNGVVRIVYPGDQRTFPNNAPAP